MAVKAYILVNIVSTNLPGALKDIGAIKGVSFVDAVTGPYDAIVKMQTPDMDELGRLITTKLLKVKGVEKTLTCVSV